MERCDEIKKDLDNFKDSSVKNNKEFLQLSFIVGEVRDTMKDHIQRTEDYKKEREDKENEYHQNVEEKLKQIEEKIQPLTNLSIASQILYKFALGLAGLIIATAGAYFAIKKLFDN